MKWTYFVVVWVTMLFTAGCSESTEKVEKNTVSKSVTHANKALELEVEGMVCEMGCGGSIRKALKATGAVTRVSFDFDEERKANFATVHFDDQQITENEIINQIQEVNNGQFKVKKLSSTALDEINKSSENDRTVNKEDESGINVTERSFSLPNLFDLFSGLF